MEVLLSKTDYILYRECPKNVWYKVHKPEVYSKSELSEFEKSIIETGNEVELIARKIFPDGILIEGRDAKAQGATEDYLKKQQAVLFQPIFIKDKCLAAIDILKFEPDSGYSVYEVKSTSSVDEKLHYHDLAFQVNLLRKYGLEINNIYLIHLNSEYVRRGELNLNELFKIVDVKAEVESIIDSVEKEAAEALEYLSQDSEPKGYCCCIYKGRSNHCSTFKHSNLDVPEYSVHDIARIGSSKAKLKELVDNHIFHLDKIPAHIKLSDIQQAQIDTYISQETLVKKEQIRQEFSNLVFPLYFLDYETFPAAIPRFDGFSPYDQIPFQYSVQILESQEAKPKNYDFLYVDANDPSESFAESLRKHIGELGSIIVWHKSFECGRNDEIATRVPSVKLFMESVNHRVYDLEEVFKKQYHIHKDFKGSSSIKKILPVLVPQLSYKELAIQEGGNAAETWNKITNGSLDEIEKEQAIKDLKIYCGLDTYAMYAIWHELCKLSV